MSVTLANLLSTACRHHQAGRLGEARALYEEILAGDPGCVDALHLLGLIHHQEHDADIAIPLIARAARLAPRSASIQSNLGEVFRAANRLDDAIAAYRSALALTPTLAGTRNNLGICFHQVGKLDDAAACFEQAIAGGLQSAAVHVNLGQVHFEQGRFAAAAGCFRDALTFNPGDAATHFNLGNALRADGAVDAALESYERALAIRPDFAKALLNRGHALKDQGRLDEAIGGFRRAIAVEPDYAAAHHSLLHVLLYHPAYDAAAIYEAHARWNRDHAERHSPGVAAHVNDRSADRPLRVGYVSPDFRAHPVGLNLLPLLGHHDREHVHVTCYSDTRAPDVVTERFRAVADAWHDVAGVGDEALAGRIRADGIDILVDVALHTANNRLGVFARKPAPIQVTFAGYPGSTGLKAIDYRFTDPYLDTPAELSGRVLHSESSVILPETFWCYDPLCDVAVGPLPALTKGQVTFGCLNNFCKINDGVLRLWGQVLNGVAGSRLMMLAPEGVCRQRVLGVLQRDGITADRVEFVSFRPRGAYMRLYERIDLGLDTLPYNGHSTSLDSYWMGVPVVTLVGDTVVGRAGVSQLSNLGLRELIARTPAEFVRIAQAWAGDVGRLGELRSGLRERMAGSALMDGGRFARGVEDAYRVMWRKWSGIPTVRIFPFHGAPAPTTDAGRAVQQKI